MLNPKWRKEKGSLLLVKFSRLLCFVPCLMLLSGCQMNGSTIIKHYLSYKYKLEDCADIGGQNNYEKIWFHEYKGVSYKDYFNLQESYLDMKTVIEDERAKGIGEINLARKDDESKSVKTQFEYYATLTDNTGGIINSTLSNEYTDFVFCIYWCRVNLKFTSPIDDEQIVLTLHFRGGEKNEYPSDFDR